MRTKRKNFRRSGRGFTIVELLVVVAIIVLLMAILLPSMGKVMSMAMRSKAMAQMHTIQQGLGQYYQQFSMYPPSSGSVGTANNGATLLAEVMLGYLDYSADGAGPANGDPKYGFRVSKPNNAAMVGTGTIYGPYVGVDPKTFNGTAFIDPWGKVILYYRSTQAGVVGGTPPTQIFGSSGTYYFNMADNSSLTGGTNAPTDARFYRKINGTGINNVSGVVTGAESYLMISPADDTTYFTDDDQVLSK